MSYYRKVDSLLRLFLRDSLPDMQARPNDGGEGCQVMPVQCGRTRYGFDLERSLTAKHFEDIN